MANILFVNHLPLKSASTYRQVGFAKYLRKLGHYSSFLGRLRVSGISDKANSGIEKEKNEEEEWKPFENIQYWREPILSKTISNIRLLSKTCRKNSILHVNRAHPFSASIVATGKPPSLPLIVDMEDWDGFGGYSSYANKYGASGWLLTGFEATFPKIADAVLVVSKLLYSHMNQYGIPRSKLFLVPNGFDEDLFYPRQPNVTLRERFGLGNSPVVMYASTFWVFERKQHELIMETFAQVVKKLPNAKLLVMGRGNLSVEELISAHGLGKNVVYAGFVPREMVPQVMASVDVALHAITNHSFHRASSPMIIPEYMAMGKAIVAPSIGEIPVMLAEGSGALVSKLDPEALSSAVIELLQNPKEREAMGKKASARARNLYSYRMLARQLEQIYRNATG